MSRLFAYFLQGRELAFYDDQTIPSTVPSIYSKLLDVDNVDLVVSGYGTNVIAPAMPIVMQRNITFMGTMQCITRLLHLQFQNSWRP